MNIRQNKCLLFLIPLLALILFPSAGRCAVTATATKLTVPSQGILPNSGPTAVIGINMTASAGEMLTNVRINITGVYGVTADDFSEVAVFYDSGSVTDAFDTGDAKIGSSPVTGLSNIDIPILPPDGHAIPLNQDGASAGDDYYVVIYTASTMNGDRGLSSLDARDRFKVSLATPTTVTTDTITCEARVVDMVPIRSDKYYYYIDNMYPAISSGYPPTYSYGPLYRYRAYSQLYDTTLGSTTDLLQNHAVPELMGMNVPYRVLGVDIAGMSTYSADFEYLQSITIVIEDTNTANFDPTTDLASHPSSPYPNISIWKDTDGDGAFDPAVDAMISIGHAFPDFVEPGKWKATVYTHTVEEGEIDGLADGNVDYFIVLATEPSSGSVATRPKYGADFKVYIDPAVSGGDGIVVRRKAGIGHPEIENCDTVIMPEGDVKDIKVVLDVKDWPILDPLEADGVPVPIFAINMTDGWSEFATNETLHWIRVWFKGTSGFKPNMLMPLSDDEDSGVSLWLDNKAVCQLGLPDNKWISETNMLSSIHRLSVEDACVQLDSSSLEWYNSDGTKWSPSNDDPAHALDDNKRYFVIIKPKSPVALYNDDYVDYTEYHDYPDKQTNRGHDLFICVKPRGISVEGTAYESADPFERGIDYGQTIDAAIGLTNSNDGGLVSASINNDHPWEDILFNSGFSATGLFENNTQPIEVTTGAATVPTFFTNLTRVNQSVNPSTKTAVIGINLVAPTGKNISFDSMDFIIIDENDPPTLEFAELVDPVSSPNDPNGGCGIALYRDNPASRDGRFTPDDLRVWIPEPKRPYLLAGAGDDPANILRVRMEFETDPGAVTSPNHTGIGFIPTDDTGTNTGPEYFLVIQPNDYMDPGDKFHVLLWGSDLRNDYPAAVEEHTINFTGDIEPYPPSMSSSSLLMGLENNLTFKRVRTHALTNTSVSSTIYTDLTYAGQTIDATSDPVGVIGINVYDVTGTNNLNSFRIRFNPPYNDDPLAFSDDTHPDSVLADLANNSNMSGIALYRDTADRGTFNWRSDTFLPTIYSTWQSDYELGFVDGDGTATDGAGAKDAIANWQGKELSFFDETDNICWYDADNNGIWSTGDVLWVDENGDEIYQTGEPVIIGSLLDYTFGVRVHGDAYGFAYSDDGSASYDDGEDIYFIGRGRDRLGWYVDVNLNPSVSLPADDNDGGPDYFIAVRTSAELKYEDSFSFTLPSNGLTFTSGPSFANTNLTTNDIIGNVNLALTDLVSPGDSILPDDEKALIGINAFDGKRDASGGGKFLKQVTLYFFGANVGSNLVELNVDGSISGVALYRESNATPGWQADDTAITLASINAWSDNKTVLTLFDAVPNPDAEIPDDSDGDDDFYVVIRTSAAATNDVIRVEIRNDLSVPAGAGTERIQLNSDSGEYLVGTNQLAIIQEAGATSLFITNPSAGDSWSGTQNLAWTVADPAFPDTYTIEYVYSSVSESGPFGGWTNLGSVPAVSGQTNYTYPVNTAVLPGAGWYAFRVSSSSGAVDRVGFEGDGELPILIDNNAITAIDISSPAAGQKYRDEISIQWTIEGTPKLNETYSIDYYREETAAWEPLAIGLTDLSYDWSASLMNRRTRIRVVAVSSGVESATGNIIIDNTAPFLDTESVSISPDTPDGRIIPDVSRGNDGRFKIFVTSSDWYTTHPTVSFTVEDLASVTDGSYAGIRAVAYRINSSSGTSGWQVRTFTGNNQSENVSIPVDFDGEGIQIDVAVIDDAQSSLTEVTADPNYDAEVYAAAGAGYNNGNYSIVYEDILGSPVNIDTVPPAFADTIQNIRIDKLPDGPNQWYLSAPVVYIPAGRVVDVGSGVLEGVVAFTIDGKDVPVVPLTPVSVFDTYQLDILNGENVVFTSYLDKIGVEKPGDAIFYFPVYNAFGKSVKIRIWDRAGNMSQQVAEVPWYITDTSEEQVTLYVDTVPPDTKVAVSGPHMPTIPFDIGTYARSYMDTWNHNKYFPRPEDAAIPSGYPYEYIDYIYASSNANAFVSPASFMINAYDRLYDIFDLGTDGISSILNKRPAVLLPGDPDYEARYDLFFSDFSTGNPGTGLADDYGPISYRFSNDTGIIVDLRAVWNDGTSFYAAGEKGVILKNDGGGWQEMPVSDASDFNGIYGTAADNIYAVGENARIYKFNGTAWSAIDVSGEFDLTVEKLPTLYAVYTNGSNVLAAGSAGNILFSMDDGGTWTRMLLTDLLPALSNVNLYAAWGDGTNVWLGGANGTIIRYDGMVWTSQTTAVSSDDIYAFASDGTNLYAFGDMEAVDGENRHIGYLSTSDGGGTWSPETTGMPSRTDRKRLPIYSAAVDSSNNVYVVGRNGAVLRYDGIWTDLSGDVSVSDVLYAVSAQGNGLWVVGGAGRTANYDGSAWTTENKWGAWFDADNGDSFNLPAGTTSVEYFAMDKLGNEEETHKIADSGRGVKKDVYEGKGTGNIRTDDYVPDPEYIVGLASEPEAAAEPNGENGWYNSPVVITLTAPVDMDGTPDVPGEVPGSGINRMEYGLGTNTSSPAGPHDTVVPDSVYNNPVSVTNGFISLTYRAIDNLGNTNGSISQPYLIYPGQYIKVDSIPPVTTVNIDGADLAFTATDNLSGVKMIRYKIDGEPLDNTDGIPYDGTVSMAGIGTVIYYWAEDNAGNFEGYNMFYPGTADGVAPITGITVNSGAFYQNPDTGVRYVASSGNANALLITRFRLYSHDPEPGTGIMTGYPVYSFNNNPPWASYVSPFSVNAGSAHIYYYARDGRGNTETTKDYIFTVDNDAPAVALEVTCDAAEERHNGWYNIASGAPTVTITADDGAGSGIKYNYYDLTGGIPATSYAGPVILSDGTYNVTYRSEDNIGNMTEDTYDYNPILVDLVKPVSKLTASDGTFYLTATDNYSGVETVNYVLVFADDSRSDAVSVNGASTSFMPYGGAKQVEYWAVDVAGNEESHKTFDLDSIIDNTPPETLISVYSGPSFTDDFGNLWVTSAENTELEHTHFQVVSTDPPDPETGFASGVAPGFPKYRMNDDADDADEEEWITYTSAFPVYSTDDAEAVWAYAKDGIGNEENPHVTRAFFIDNEKPFGSVLAVDISPSETTGWYNMYTGAPTITITGTEDAGSDVKEVRYTRDGATDPSATAGVIYSEAFILDNTQVPEIRYAGIDNLGHVEDVKSYLPYFELKNLYGINVDRVPPAITVNMDYPNGRFSLTVTDALSGVDWGGNNVTYRFTLEGDIFEDGTYSQGSYVEVPDNAEKLRISALDIAGNQSEQELTFPINRKVSGYIKTYKGAAMSGVKVLLSGDTNSNYTTGASGYYEFTGLRALGSYYVVPVLTNNLPVARFYPVFGETDLTNQDFETVPGWMSERYDRGGSRDYRFGATAAALSPLYIAESASIGTYGTSMLSGFLDVDDQRMNILMSDGAYVRGYVHDGSIYTLALSGFTPYNLSFVGSVRADTTIDLVLCGTGSNIAEIRDNTGESIAEINAGRLSGDLQSAPGNVEWSTNMSLGKGGVVFTGAGTGYNAMFLYNCLSDTVEWETSLTHTVLPGTSALCLRADGRAMILTGAQSDTSDLTLAAVDAMTGVTVWTKVFAGIRGSVTPVVFVNDTGADEILAVRTSTNVSLGPMQVYRLSAANGATMNTWQVFSLTPNANTLFRAAVADLDNNGVKEMVVSDGSGNMYVLNMATGSVASAAGRGILWAVVDIDGKADGYKEIIASAGREIRVISSSLEVLASRDMGVDDIYSVIVSDTTGSGGLVEILVSIPGSTRILRPALNSDLPTAPAGLDAYSTDGRAYIVWSYSSTSAYLSGFRVWRSTDPGDPASWVLAATTASSARSYIDSPPAGIYAYRVSAYNDFGESFSGSSVALEVVASSGGGGGGASCFIATAAFGTPMAQEVVRLKNFRDSHLLANRYGRSFVRWYYRHSPSVAEYIRHRKVARALVRASLRPLLWILSF